jgi:hypothetical protein
MRSLHRNKKKKRIRNKEKRNNILIEKKKIPNLIPFKIYKYTYEFKIIKLCFFIYFILFFLNNKIISTYSFYVIQTIYKKKYNNKYLFGVSIKQIAM